MASPQPPSPYPLEPESRPGQATSFLGRRSVRDTWIALWVLWLLWAGLFIAKQTFGETRRAEARRVQDARVGHDTDPYSTAAVDTTAPVPGEVLVPENERGRELSESPTHAEAETAAVGGTRPARAHHKGLFGRAIDNMLAIALMWALLMMLVESRILDMMLGSMEMLILLAMLIAAYSIGWEAVHD
ncbi:hypothetical protein BG003_009949 [Podila horticola]|nr:hypothetical protein BG003_009949 [Podila horticola]